MGLCVLHLVVPYDIHGSTHFCDTWGFFFASCEKVESSFAHKMFAGCSWVRGKRINICLSFLELNFRMVNSLSMHLAQSYSNGVRIT